VTASAATACPACGRDARQDARFRDVCGSPITSGAVTAEYKQLTVLFADLAREVDGSHAAVLAKLLKHR
jgi:hypothetical protein